MGKKEEVIWKKAAYPENHTWMYGMSHYSLQLNYFPNQLKNVIAPTDSRRRPDQRALENGQMELAAAHKDRLEVKQRAHRKHLESAKVDYAPCFFKKWFNPSDQKEYYIYNHKYFETNREKQDWSKSPDIFSNECSPEISKYLHTSYAKILTEVEAATNNL